MEIVHHSKIDTWLLAVMIISAAIPLFVIAAAISMRSTGAIVTSVLIALVGSGLPLWFLFSTHYTIADRELIVRSGPATWRVELAGISSITPSRNLMSSPALSLDRLRVEYGKGRVVLVSPRDSAQFIRDIEAARGSAI